MDDFQREVGEWADKTFPQSTLREIIFHLREELDELFEATTSDESVGLWPDDHAIREESADCLLLLLYLAHKMDFSLFDAAKEKNKINRRRNWEIFAGSKGYRKHEDEGG